ncbi:MAG: hypothetical protein Q9217_005069 [Psora testacea]
MSFVIRRPFALTSTIKQLPRSISNPLRALHTTPKASTKPNFEPASPITTFAKARNAFGKTLASPRSYTNPAIPTSTGTLAQRLLYGAAIVGGTVVATNAIFNRETRDDGGMAPYERNFLNDTFMHTGLGVGMIGVAAQALHRSGWSFRLMSMNPWVVIGVGLVGSIGSMMATRATDPENYVQKYALWSTFNLAQAAILSPLMFLQPALLARAGLYTVAMMGSIAFVGATAKQEKYLYLGGPLLAGVAIVAVSGFAPLVLPATAARTLMWTERVWLYGGLAVFGGFTLYDTQKILQHARLAERGLVKRDVVNESISLELDFLNIFIRMVQILGMQRSNRR